ncbi:hypothetical protein D3C79_952810 [compost metagenome]
MVADHHLQLAAGLDDGDDSLHPFQHLFVDPSHIFQDKPQPGGAVGDAYYITVTANQLDDLFRRVRIVNCHIYPSLPSIN